MGTPSRLSNPPLAEAVFDIRVVPRIGMKPEELLPGLAAIKQEFPDHKELKQFQTSIQAGPGAMKQETQDLGVLGYFVTSKDEKDIVQFRTDGFTANRLTPYSSWEELIPKVLNLWEEYRAVARPKEVTRVALRYINRLPQPSAFDLAAVLEFPPSVPAQLQPLISEYFARTVFQDAVHGSTTVLTSAVQPSQGPASSALLLDIDTFFVGARSVDTASLRQVFETLHEVKNMVFFGSLTDQALEPYR